MITKAQYFGNKPHPIEHEANACRLIDGSANLFLKECHELGHYDYEIDPDTGTQISGSKGGTGAGGYRGKNEGPTLHSTHKDANGIDIADSVRKLAAYCVTHEGKAHMARHGLYMEDPRWTPVWCHFQRVAPKSGKRIYIPSMSAPLAPALPGQKPIPFTVKT